MIRIALITLAAWLITGAVRAEEGKVRVPGRALVCAPATAIFAQLKAAGEEPIRQGVAGNGELFQLWSSANGETWTAISTSPNGVTCMVAVGRLLHARVHSALEEAS